jgi:cobalt/nickel transport system permease protein
MAVIARKRMLGRGDFVARTVGGLTGALERAMYSEEQARRPGLLQRTDPRVKVVAIVLLIGTAALAHHLPSILAVYLVGLGLAYFSRLSLGGLMKKSWLGITLFSGLVFIPALLTLPGHPLLVLLDAPPFRLAITDDSLVSTLTFVSRVGTSVSLALLLVSTTRWTDLLRALQGLQVPEAFVTVLGMTYRYLFLFLHTTNNLFLARTSRTVGRTSRAEQRRWTASAAGVLIGRSVRLSGDVHQAMRARGFTGSVRTLSEFRFRDEDGLLLALTAVAVAVLLLVDGRILWL